MRVRLHGPFGELLKLFEPRLPNPYASIKSS